MSKYFDIFAYLMGKQAGGGGGGGDITVESKSISANGTYTAPTGKAYSPVTVSVPASAVDSGTKSITSNGNNQDVVGYAAVDVAVPNSYAAGDEGKVVSNGALVAQGSDSVTQNGTVDTTLINSLNVNVSGGGGGLEYETGTYTPSEDVAQPTISFANTHSELPLLVTMEDATGTYDGTTDTNYYFTFMNFSGFTGETLRQSSTSQLYAYAYYAYRTSSATSLVANNALITNAPDSQTSGPSTYVNWITASSFFPGSNNTSRYWRSGRTYKWIAVWAPSA